MIKGKRKFREAFEIDEDNVSNYFQQHFEEILDPAIAATLLASINVENEPKRIVLENIGIGLFQQCYSKLQDNTLKQEKIENFGLNSKLMKNFEILNGSPMSSAQLSLYTIIGKYIDFYASELQIDCTPLYCLHTINHVTQTRNMVIKNKQYLQERREKGTLTENDIEKTRDQGLSRPKVLIICPMKKNVFPIIENFRMLIFGDSDKPFISNYRRFKTEFGDTGFRISEKRKVSVDYRELMSGNTDDCFRIGVALAKKSLKLYTAFDESDILIASPLGLRMIIGENDGNNSERETDFLASIEVLIIDKADILLMQNWEHLLNIISSLHIQPKKFTADISRVRRWSLEQYSRLYRQTVLISEKHHAECDALFVLYCKNFAGFVKLLTSSQGLLNNIEIPYCQELQRIDVDVAENQSDIRFKFFKEKILPKCELGTVIFIPSYFDFVRIRNYLKNENESFVQLHEYAKEGKVAKARELFYKKEKKFMLITERFHFYRRYSIKGIKSLTFYQSPAQPRFYHEMINQVDCNYAHVRLLYTKFDFLRMTHIFGDNCIRQIMSSTKTTHVLVSR
uniref:U3 small nucleolar RNA-associated protein 25 homolog n=1 Tax=Onchocerca volvulus TaxID=6282 RepID=A0A2K6WDF7_ONCVO